MNYRDYADVAAYLALPRTTGLALSVDGTRLVAVRQDLDADRTKYVPSLWEIPLAGAGECMRLTHSAKGESAPAFRPDGSLLFTSARPSRRRRRGRQRALVVAAGRGRPGSSRAGRAGSAGRSSRSGPERSCSPARGSRSRPTPTTPSGGRPARTARSARSCTTRMPIRYWDHELDEESTRLLHLDRSRRRADRPAAARPCRAVDDVLLGQRGRADRRSRAWRRRGSRGRSPYSVVLVDVATARAHGARRGGRRRVPHAGDRARTGCGSRWQRESDATFAAPHRDELIVARARSAATGGRRPRRRPRRPSGPGRPTRSSLVVAGDWHGRGAVLVVDAATGEVTRRVASDAVYTSLCVARTDGTSTRCARA